MSVSSFLWNVLASVVGAVVFSVLLVLVAVAYNLRRQLSLLKIVGATHEFPHVEIILSNLTTDGVQHKPQGTQDTSVGYTGSGFAAPEVEAARAFQKSLTGIRIPLFPEGFGGPLKLLRAEAHIRPSSFKVGVEAEHDFVLDRGRCNHTRAVIVIGSPAYNRASYDILGATRDIDYLQPERFSAPSPPPCEAAQRLQARSFFLWERDHTGIPTGEENASPEERVLYPRGVRGFVLKDRPTFIAGRVQRETATEVSHEQSIIQQLRVECADRSGGGKPTDRVVTLFAGVSSGGTAAAVKVFLTGEYNWSFIRHQLKKQKGYNKGRGFCFWFTRPVPFEQVDREVVHLDQRGTLPGVQAGEVRVEGFFSPSGEGSPD